MGGRIPPHCLVDVDVVDEEGYELAEEELQFKQNAGLDWQLRDLAVLQGHDSLGGQWRAGEARPRTAPGGERVQHQKLTGEPYQEGLLRHRTVGAGSEKQLAARMDGVLLLLLPLKEADRAFPYPSLIFFRLSNIPQEGKER